ncbi:hypothetical protein SYJ56_02780 [Algoriphagus sp. D3-2-R+10]|uniref:hypothetical protein n=1 Tax=Algoriphagus aurantiacus TaxID=3103948 RepID=UPI002B3D96F2|nr:hypothetical protein [Algoriphagus sp. D3-2-R+10]MEB2774212.1 hypothetical protein [Algoriphagus sp. D3-2-R+10]
MKKSVLLVFGISLLMVLVAAWTFRSEESPYNLEVGTPEIKSITSLAFGPEGILFIGDSKSAKVYAVNTKDANNTSEVSSIDVQGIDEKLAVLLGTTVDNISILDIAVNPISKKLYLAIQSSDGTPILMTLEDEDFEPVSLQNVEFAEVELNNSPAEDAKDGRGRSLRISAISDIGYSDGKLMVSGLSNKEFSSTFRSIPFPFTDEQDYASLEIYHAAHGKYETTSPIKTFTTAKVNGKDFLIASYTCTPLVLFPLDELKAGTHVKGRTIAEMGSGNQPLDIVNMEKDGKSYLVMANSNRPVFRIDFKDIESFEGSLTEPVTDNFATDGVDFVSMPLTNVQQLDKMDDGTMVLLQRKSNGSLDLWSTDKAEYLLK